MRASSKDAQIHNWTKLHLEKADTKTERPEWPAVAVDRSGG